MSTKEQEREHPGDADEKRSELESLEARPVIRLTIPAGTKITNGVVSDFLITLVRETR